MSLRRRISFSSGFLLLLLLNNRGTQFYNPFIRTRWSYSNLWKGNQFPPDYASYGCDANCKCSSANYQGNGNKCDGLMKQSFRDVMYVTWFPVVLSWFSGDLFNCNVGDIVYNVCWSTQIGNVKWLCQLESNGFKCHSLSLCVVPSVIN